MRVTLNGAYMKNKERAHRYIKWKLGLPVYYGKNLDALWDVLTSLGRPLQITLVNKKLLLEQLGDYGVAIINTIEEAAEENNNLDFQIN